MGVSNLAYPEGLAKREWKGGDLAYGFAPMGNVLVLVFERKTERTQGGGHSRLETPQDNSFCIARCMWRREGGWSTWLQVRPGLRKEGRASGARFCF